MLDYESIVWTDRVAPTGSTSSNRSPWDTCPQVEWVDENEGGTMREGMMERRTDGISSAVCFGCFGEKQITTFYLPFHAPIRNCERQAFMKKKSWILIKFRTPNIDSEIRTGIMSELQRKHETLFANYDPLPFSQIKHIKQWKQILIFDKRNMLPFPPPPMRSAHFTFHQFAPKPNILRNRDPTHKQTPIGPFNAHIRPSFACVHTLSHQRSTSAMAYTFFFPSSTVPHSSRTSRQIKWKRKIENRHHYFVVETPVNVQPSKTNRKYFERRK